MFTLSRLGIAILCLFALASCTENHEQAHVGVRVLSDLRPVIEAHAAEVEVFHGVLGESSEAIEHKTRTLSESDSLAEGVVLAELDAVSRGTYTIWARLKKASGDVLVERPFVVNVTGDATYSVHLTASCVGVMCPAVGTSASLSACVAHQCVDPTCSPSTPELCPSQALCDDDGDCTTTSTCARAQCIEHQCMQIADDGACDSSEQCTHEGGCIPRTPSIECETPCVLANDPCHYGCSMSASGESTLCIAMGQRPSGAPCGESQTCDESAACVAVATNDAGVDAESDAETDADVNDGSIDAFFLDAQSMDAPWTDSNVSDDASHGEDMSVTAGDSGVSTTDSGTSAGDGSTTADDAGNAHDGAVEFVDGGTLDARAVTDANALADATADAAPDVCTPTMWYLDDDEDLYGDATDSVEACAAPSGYVSNDDDCDDDNDDVHPGATETCNAIDDDCDGSTDESLTFTNYYVDNDGDLFGDGTPTSECSDPGSGYVAQDGDCNDGNAQVFPGATELCNAVDDDCDDAIDDGLTFTNYYVDNDGDTYGVGSASSECTSPGSGYATQDGDCDDENDDANPGATEVCDTIDDDCDGDIDEDVHSSLTACGATCAVCPTANGTPSCDGTSCHIVCNAGFTESGGECVDIDECSNGTNTCVLNQTCNNAAGSYSCSTMPTVVTGTYHACAITSTGGVRCWGTNTNGQLGYGDTTNRFSPGAAISLGTGRTAIDLAAGDSHTCAILDDRSLKCWGKNTNGQLGDASTTQRESPTSVNLGTGRFAYSVTAGGAYTCAILDDRSVKCWGLGSSGQLGYGDTAQRTAPESAPINLGEGRTARRISAGDLHACAILDDATVKCWGAGSNGRIGNGSSSQQNSPVATNALGEDAVWISAGMAHTCAALASGTAKCWGTGAQYRLGQGASSSDSNTPLTVQNNWSGSARIIAAGQNTCANQYYYPAYSCWGYNDYGQLGMGDNMDRPNTVAMSNNIYIDGRSDLVAFASRNQFACAINPFGVLKCWGRNTEGQLGYGNQTQPYVTSPPTAPLAFGSGRTGATVGMHGSGFSGCIVLDDGSLRCIGENVYGALGVGGGDPRFVPNSAAAVSTGGAVSQVAGGQFHACALLTNGSVKCWGLGNYGALGYGNTLTQRTPPETAVDLGSSRTALAITASYTSSCALLDDHSVKCWGNNSTYGYGYATTTQINAPASAAIDLGTNRTALAISAGDYHYCAMLDDHSVKCWGYNNKGQLGYNDTTNRAVPATAAINLGTNRTATSISAGGSATCAILDDGTTKCWGNGSALGYGDYADRSMPPATAVLSFGTGYSASSISMGSTHACAVRNDGAAVCWGSGGFGQLGYGNMSNVSAPSSTPIDLGSGRTARSIHAGYTHTCAVLDDYSVKCWGYNNKGQVGVPGTYWAPAPSGEQTMNIND